MDLKGNGSLGLSCLMRLVCCKILRSKPLSLLNCPNWEEKKKNHKARG